MRAENRRPIVHDYVHVVFSRLRGNLGEMATPLLSVFIITYNESHDLPDCLASVTIADEIVVVDQGSTDDTRQIAEAAGARVLERAFEGFGVQKQAALEATTGEWVLSLDADERITPALAAEIAAVIRGQSARNGYVIRREVEYLGKRLRFGGHGAEWVPRLARRSKARFTSARVHERMVIDGPVARLRAPMLHLTYRDLTEHMQVIDRYTTAIAIEKSAAGKQFRASHVLRIPLELFTRLVLKLGFLDGKAGIIWSAMAAHYAFLKYAKLYRRRTRSNSRVRS